MLINVNSMSSTRKNVKMKQQLTLICFIVSSVFSTLISISVRTIIFAILFRNKDLRISQNIIALSDTSHYSILGSFTITERRSYSRRYKPA